MSMWKGFSECTKPENNTFCLFLWVWNMLLSTKDDLLRWWVIFYFTRLPIVGRHGRLWILQIFGQDNSLLLFPPSPRPTMDYELQGAAPLQSYTFSTPTMPPKCHGWCFHKHTQKTGLGGVREKCVSISVIPWVSLDWALHSEYLGFNIVPSR